MKRIPHWMLAACLASSPAFADFDQAALAHAMGDYDRALELLLPLAETSGHPYAQHYLGVMYEQGQGVARDYREAARWFRAAAEQGVASAQLKLARLYETGQGVPKDMEFAYAWYSVAVHLGNTRAAPGLEATRVAMTGAERAQAQALASQYIERYGRPPPGTRVPQ
jgi:TPR repeat protein